MTASLIRGNLIAFEGGDGVGKNTQSLYLARELNVRGRTTAHFSFPRYETPVGRAIRRHLMCETMLAVAKRQNDEHNGGCDGSYENGRCDCDRYGLLRSSDDALAFQSLMLVDKCDADVEMRALLAAGTDVVCDRWLDSSLAYGAADQLDRTWLEHIHSGLSQPDLTIFLRVPEEVALARRPALRDRYEKDRAKQAAVAANYEELARTKKGWVVVDGSGSVDDVAAEIWKHVIDSFEARVRRVLGLP